MDVFSNAMGKTIQLRPGKASNNKYFVLLFYKYIFCAVIRLIVSKWCSFALYLFGIMMTLTFSFEAIFKLLPVLLCIDGKRSSIKHWTGNMDSEIFPDHLLKHCSII